MRLVRLFLVPATLLATGNAAAGDSWSRVDGEEIVYEEVADRVFMPEGLYDSLPNADELVELIEKDAQSSQKAGVSVSTTNWSDSGFSCTTTKVTVTVEIFGSTHTEWVSTTTCQKT